MSLYAIGDLHLSLGSDKPMDVFGGGWNNYVEKIKHGFSKLTPDDVCVLCGDTSWGMTLDESLEDFKFLSELPCRKIILKGNHDYWWTTAAKMKAFLENNGITDIDILSNNSFVYDDCAICGTRGWLTDEASDTEHDRKIISREAARLTLSLKSAGSQREKLCFLHYPPVYKNTSCAEIIDVMIEYGVNNCWYGHIHGYGHRFAREGETGGITYKMISADYLDFTPKRIM